MTSTRLRSVDTIVDSVRASRLPASSLPTMPRPYNAREIRSPWLREVINLACDAEAILSGAVHFEPFEVNNLRDRLGEYASSLAQQYAARLDNLGYVVDLSTGTLDGHVQLDAGEVQGLIRGLEPYADRSGEIRKLHTRLITTYAPVGDSLYT